MNYLKGSTKIEEYNLRELTNHIGEEVSIKGIVYKIRQMGEFSFVILRTLYGNLQCIYEKGANFDLEEVRENYSVEFKGIVKTDERSPVGFELVLTGCRVLSLPFEAVPPVIINNKEVQAGLDTLLNYRPITLRNEKQRAIFKIQDVLCQAFREFFIQHNFTEIHSPKIVYSSAEGGANLFQLDYFGKKAYLTQSPQFYKQMLVAVYERVFEIAPVFRAEKHNTSRHINEYTSIDMEMGFINSFYDIMKMETALLEWVFEYLKENAPYELQLLSVEIPEIKEIPVITFMEAKKLIEKKYKKIYEDEGDFEPEEEKRLNEIIKEETGSEFVFVTHYKSSKRPFYTMDTEEEPEYTESFDLLFRGLEITTGGQRIHDYTQQIEKMERKGLNPEDFQGYLTAHKYGLPPHGGFGLGLERLMMQLLGYSNVRYTTMFPRDTQRLMP